LTALNPKRKIGNGGEITKFFDEMIDFNHVIILNEPPSPLTQAQSLGAGRKPMGEPYI
jgi:hypothetical protein